MITDYPKHIYEDIRFDLAENYLIHELRKLLGRVGRDNRENLELDIKDLRNSKELANPRDFWNGFHGVCMGFKLKTGLIYAVTAENVRWVRRRIKFEDINFGVELPQTLEVAKGKLNAQVVRDFYSDKKNVDLKNKYLKLVSDIFGQGPRGSDPIFAFEMKRDGKITTYVNDGNGRLGKAVLGEKHEIDAYVGSFTSDEVFHNYWVPTSVLIDNLYFAKLAFEKGDMEIFKKFIEVTAEMTRDSESGRFELLNRAITSQQPFRDETLKLITDFLKG